MPPRISAVSVHHGRHLRGGPGQHGEGFFGDAWNWIKDKKLISKGVGALVPGFAGKAGGTLLGLAGLGRKRRKAGTKKKATAKQTGGRRKKSTRKKSTRKTVQRGGARKKATRSRSIINI